MKFRFRESYSTPFFSIEEGFDEDVDYNSSQDHPYYRINTLDSVICCAMTQIGEFIVVNQYRPSINSVTLELPAGTLLADESPILAANREFEEETGMKCNFIPLGEFHLMVNRINSKEHIFFGFEPEIWSGKSPENGIEVKKILRSDLVKLSINGGYKQIAGLGVIQMASAFLGLDILTSDMEDISKKFSSKFN